MLTFWLQRKVTSKNSHLLYLEPVRPADLQRSRNGQRLSVLYEKTKNVAHCKGHMKECRKNITCQFAISNNLRLHLLTEIQIYFCHQDIICAQTKYY